MRVGFRFHARIIAALRRCLRPPQPGAGPKPCAGDPRGRSHPRRWPFWLIKAARWRP
jgi:hypothetical protein